MVEINYVKNIKNYIENNIVSNKVRNLEKERDKLITYYNIGKEIIKAQSEDKIKYGNSFIKKLSIELTELYGKGYDYTNLRRMKQFYLAFPNVATLSPTFIIWSHMREILPIKNKRNYYINIIMSHELSYLIENILAKAFQGQVIWDAKIKCLYSVSTDDLKEKVYQNNKIEATTKTKFRNQNEVKGNIPINKKLLNKYSNAKEIFKNETNNFDAKINVKISILELKDVDVLNSKPKEIKEKANSIFKKYNSKSVFKNNGNKIKVSKGGINESIEKIYSNRKQRNLLKEHLQVFSDLGDIIEQATLVSQTKELKNRNNINSWNYYFVGLNINGELYDLEFDVRSLNSGENQYRVQRLEKKQTTHSGDVSNNTKILPAFEQSASDNNNIIL